MVIEPCFDQDSYGYRPNRTASDAIAKARERFHYTFDKWMRIHYPNIPFERYADDTICHCMSKAQAEYLKEVLTCRFEHSEKSVKKLHEKMKEWKLHSHLD